MKKGKLRYKRGITLIELIIVMAILGTLMTILFVSLRDPTRDEMTRKLQMMTARTQIDAALFQFKERFGRYPTDDEGIDALVEAPPGINSEDFPSGGFLMNKRMLKDPWKKTYKYESSESGYKIFTYGADGVPGGEGENRDIDLTSLE